MNLPSQICDFFWILSSFTVGAESIASKAFGQGLKGDWPNHSMSMTAKLANQTGDCAPSMEAPCPCPPAPRCELELLGLAVPCMVAVTHWCVSVGEWEAFAKALWGMVMVLESAI